MEKNLYTDFEDLLVFFRRKRKECPKGVSLKLKANKYLVLQFILPDTGKYSEKSCNTKFTEEGIIIAISKAKKVADALKSFSLASDFWNWYDEEILEASRIENDLKTYKQIFQEIEENYFNGFHKNTGRHRDRNNLSDQNSFRRTKEYYFKRFPKKDIYPNWSDIQKILFSWKQGTKSFRDAYYFLRDVANRSGDTNLVKVLDEINPKQTIFSEKQSCSWDDFYSWYQLRYDELSSLPVEIAEKRKGWLWVSAMCVMYGLRPSEIAAAENLTTSWTKDGVTIPAINNPENNDLLLVIGEFTYFGSTTKTGSRISRPMIADKKLWDDLHLQDINLPQYKPISKKPEVVVRGFSDRFCQALKRMNAPITQAYALRHLANQLGEKYGIPQEIRARILGHSVAVNDRVYKSRKNLKTEIDLLVNHSRQPLSHELAVERITASGVEIDSTISFILNIIYQRG